MSLYEGMFLIDNDAVRAGWASAKANVTDLIAKHGGKLHTGRRWDERRLAYPVKKKNRATFLRAFYEIDSERIQGFVRDLEINEKVLRYLLLAAETVPADELEAAKAEMADDFVVPEPPADDVLDPEPTSRSADDDDDDGPPSRRRSDFRGDSESSDSKDAKGAKDDEKDEKASKKEPVAVEAAGESKEGGEG